MENGIYDKMQKIIIAQTRKVNEMFEEKLFDIIESKGYKIDRKDKESQKKFAKRCIIKESQFSKDIITSTLLIDDKPVAQWIHPDSLNSGIYQPNNVMQIASYNYKIPIPVAL
jgi:hypothetical protein